MKDHSINSTFRASKPIYIFCPICGNKAWIEEDHDKHQEGTDVDFVAIEGVFVYADILNSDEEQQLIKLIDEGNPWVPSQEGRAKQDFGPKVNFLARKVSVGNFSGFPRFAVDLFQRIQLNYEKILEDFIPVEFCILEYIPARGSYIRPHYDDKWVWGDRLVTVNLLSETTLRLTREFNIPPYEIAIRLPARSLVVIQGEARYNWHHSINKYDIKSRRIALTWREFSEEITSDSDYSDFVMDVFGIVQKSNRHRS